MQSKNFLLAHNTNERGNSTVTNKSGLSGE